MNHFLPWDKDLGVIFCGRTMNCQVVTGIQTHSSFEERGFWECIFLYFSAWRLLMPAGKMGDGHRDELECLFFSQAKPNLARTGYFSASSCRGLHLPGIASEFNSSELLNKSLLGLKALPSTRWLIFSSLMTFHLSSFVFSSAFTQTSHESSSTPVVSGRCLCLCFSLLHVETSGFPVSPHRRCWLH